MFVCTMKNGVLLVEGRDVKHFNDIPDNGISSMQLMMPYVTYRRMGNKKLKRNAVISIGRYDKYYCSKQAVANILSIKGGIGNPNYGGQGEVTHEILAGIDLSNNEVLYIKLQLSTGDITVDKFNYDWWIKTYGVNPAVFKNGAPKK